MTTPNSITVSPEWAKKLKKAGWPQEPFMFRWIEPCQSHGMIALQIQIADREDQYEHWPEDHKFAAPTAEEILRRCGEYWRCCNTAMGTPRCWIEHELGKSQFFDADTLANAAAAMWVYLKQNKLLP